MKIRSIALTNFRKFVGTVSVDGIGDGVSVLVGRNEIGKSTILQAINGVIFEKANSTSQRVRDFRHFVNGTVPEVELRFDLDGVSWTIRKRFADSLAAPSSRLPITVGSRTRLRKPNCNGCSASAPAGAPLSPGFGGRSGSAKAARSGPSDWTTRPGEHCRDVLKPKLARSPAAPAANEFRTPWKQRWAKS